MDKKKTIAIMFCVTFLLTFSVAIIALSIAGWMLSNVSDVWEVSIITGEGLRYESIAQFFLFALIFSVMSTLLLGDILFKETLLLWRLVILYVLTALLCVVFALVFRWFPHDMAGAWFSYLGLFTLGFGLGIFGLIVKTMRVDLKYKKLLSDYKTKQSEEE